MDQRAADVVSEVRNAQTRIAQFLGDWVVHGRPSEQELERAIVNLQDALKDLRRQ